MIEVVKIENFVINQLFLPYSVSIHGVDGWHENITEDEKYKYMLSNNPEKIIDLLSNKPLVKERVFERLKKCGGVKWYRYLDMSNPVIQWVNENLEGNGRWNLKTNTLVLSITAFVNTSVSLQSFWTISQKRKGCHVGITFLQNHVILLKVYFQLDFQEALLEECS